MGNKSISALALDFRLTSHRSPCRSSVTTRPKQILTSRPRGQTRTVYYHQRASRHEFYSALAVPTVKPWARSTLHRLQMPLSRSLPRKVGHLCWALVWQRSNSTGMSSYRSSTLFCLFSDHVTLRTILQELPVDGIDQTWRSSMPHPPPTAH